jgi:hypothetical protein
MIEKISNNGKSYSVSHKIDDLNLFYEFQFLQVLLFPIIMILLSVIIHFYNLKKYNEARIIISAKYYLLKNNGQRTLTCLL